MVIDFSSFYDFPRGMDRIFDEMERTFLHSGRRYSYPLVNLSEDDDNFYVDVDVPGVPMEDIELTLTEKSLVIKGERKPVEGRYYRRERSLGTFQRVVRIGVPVDREKAAAKMTDGILTVVLPKSEAVKPRKISIEA